MKTFTVTVKMTSWLEVDIAAPDEDTAYAIADNMDGGEFTEYEASWNIENIREASQQ